MKTRLLVGLILWGMIFAATAGLTAASQPTTSPALSKGHTSRLQWWRDARFGMFIHWGPVTLAGTEIGWSRGAEVPIGEYDNLYKRFNPTEFDANEWVRIAKDAGMKYIVLTTKHHDGFCLFDTKQIDYSIMNSPYGRDVVKELAAACRRQGMAFGTYYSVCDWHHPDFPHGSPGGTSLKPNPNLDRYEEYLKNQVAELIHNDGPLLTMWFDVAQDFDAERGRRVVDFVRSLQPDILINNRCANDGDYDTPEQSIGRFQTTRPWESCITIGTQWSWKPNDDIKSVTECIQTLVRCAGGDGNLLLNVGPMPTGEIESRQVSRLHEVGRWLARYGRSIYGTRGGPIRPSPWGCTTSRGNTIYVHVMSWPGESLMLPGINRRIVASSILTGGKVHVNQSSTGTEIRLTTADRQAIDTIIALKLDGSAINVKTTTGSLTFGKKATASNVFHQSDDYRADQAIDDDGTTRWATDEGTHQAWLEVDMGKAKTFASVQTSEYATRVQAFELQAWQDGRWRTFLYGTTIGEQWRKRFPPVTAQRVRLNILNASEGPTIWELQLFKAG